MSNARSLYSTNLLHNVGCIYDGMSSDANVETLFAVLALRLLLLFFSFLSSFCFAFHLVVNASLTSNGGCLKCCCAVLVAKMEMFYGCHSNKSARLCTVNSFFSASSSCVCAPS